MTIVHSGRHNIIKIQIALHDRNTDMVCIKTYPHQAKDMKIEVPLPENLLLLSGSKSWEYYLMSDHQPYIKGNEHNSQGEYFRLVLASIMG